MLKNLLERINELIKAEAAKNNRLKELEKKVKENDSKLKDLEKQIVDKEKQIADKDAEIKELEASVKKLESDIAVDFEKLNDAITRLENLING